ncbi:MAG: hypothetical protein SNI45_07580 [Rikenellaceae bacterium]
MQLCGYVCAAVDDFNENSARELTNNLNSLRAIVLYTLNDCAGQTINKEWLEGIDNGTRITYAKKKFAQGSVKRIVGSEGDTMNFASVSARSSTSTILI